MWLRFGRDASNILISTLRVVSECPIENPRSDGMSGFMPKYKGMVLNGHADFVTVVEQVKPVDMFS